MSILKKTEKPLTINRVEVSPDWIYDEEWEEPDGIKIKVGRHGWSWAIFWDDSDDTPNWGTADTREQAIEDVLRVARELTRMLETERL